MCKCNLCNRSTTTPTNLGNWFVRFPNIKNPQLVSVHGMFVGNVGFTDEQVKELEADGKTVECPEHELAFQKLLVEVSVEFGMGYDYEANAYPSDVSEEAWKRMLAMSSPVYDLETV